MNIQEKPVLRLIFIRAAAGKGENLSILETPLKEISPALVQSVKDDVDYGQRCSGEQSVVVVCSGSRQGWATASKIVEDFRSGMDDESVSLETYTGLRNHKRAQPFTGFMRKFDNSKSVRTAVFVVDDDDGASLRRHYEKILGSSEFSRDMSDMRGVVLDVYEQDAQGSVLGSDKLADFIKLVDEGGHSYGLQGLGLDPKRLMDVLDREP